MADVTINQLTSQAPALSDAFPFSTTGVTPSTYKASLTQIKSGLGLATVATTGSYTDLINRPTTIIQAIGSVLNGPYIKTTNTSTWFDIAPSSSLSITMTNGNNNVLILTALGNTEDDVPQEDIVKIYNACIYKYGHRFLKIIIAIPIWYGSYIFDLFNNNIVRPQFFDDDDSDKEISKIKNKKKNKESKTKSKNL